MHSSKDEVASERRLDGDLRGLFVTNFADHDFVGIVPQDGSQATRKRESLLLIYRNLRDSPDLVFHGIFYGDDFIFVGLDLIDGRIERGRLAAPSGAGDQHHPVRLFDIPAELSQIFFVEADNVEHQRPELLTHRLFVQNAQHGVFTVN